MRTKKKMQKGTKKSAKNGCVCHMGVIVGVYGTSATAANGVEIIPRGSFSQTWYKFPFHNFTDSLPYFILRKEFLSTL